MINFHDNERAIARKDAARDAGIDALTDAWQGDEEGRTSWADGKLKLPLMFKDDVPAAQRTEDATERAIAMKDAARDAYVDGMTNAWQARG